MECIDTTLYVVDYGEKALEDYLKKLDLLSLKKIFRFNRIDRTLNLNKKSLTREILIEKILERSSIRAHRGDAFRT